MGQTKEALSTCVERVEGKVAESFMSLAAAGINCFCDAPSRS